MGLVDYSYQVRRAPHVIRSFLLYNDSIIGDFTVNYAAPDGGASGLTGVGGAATRGYAEWESATDGGVRKVRLEWDTALDHTGMDGANRWLTAASAWAFMKASPQP